MEFRVAPLDTFSRTATPLTAFVALLLVGVPMMVGPHGDAAERATQAVGLVLGLMVCVSWAVMPRTLAVDEAGLLISAPLGGSRLTRDSVKGIREIEARETVGLRLLGGSGLFGHWGLFRTPDGERVSLRASRRFPAVRVDRKAARPLILAPADPAGFVRAWNDGQPLDQ